MLTVILFISWRAIENQPINPSSILKIAVNMEVTHPETGRAGYQRPDRPARKAKYAILSRSCRAEEVYSLQRTKATFRPDARARGKLRIKKFPLFFLIREESRETT